MRPLLHKMLADEDENAAVRRLAVLVLKNGSAQRDTIVLLEGLAADDERRTRATQGSRGRRAAT